MDTLRFMGLLALGLAVVAPVHARGPGATDDPEVRTVEVRMVDKGPTEFVFEPAEIQVRPGDRVVWVQTGVMPHNVQFTTAPGAAELEALPASPFLTMKEQRYEMVIDERFPVGAYEYICTPHAAMGMTGAIEIVPSSGTTDTP